MKKRDYSNLSHTQPRVRPSLLPPFKDALIIFGGGHPTTARLVSSEEELLTFMILGTVLLLAACMTASTVTTVLHSAAGDGNFHIGYLSVGVLVGAMQGATDNILQYRTKFVERGYAQIAVAGTQLPLMVRSGVETVMLNIMRFLQSVSISILAALSIVLVALSSSTATYTANKFRIDNPVVYAEATRQVDAAIKTTSEDVSASTGRIDQVNRMLASLRLENTRRAVRARTSGVNSSAPDAQIAKLENTLAAETANRDTLKAALAKQSVSRETDIEHKIAASPNAIPKLTGLSGQLDALAALVKNDWGLLLIALTLQVVSCALELSPMWITLRYFPSNYASHVAVERFLTARATAERCAEQLEGAGFFQTAKWRTEPDFVSDSVLGDAETTTSFAPVVQEPERAPSVAPFNADQVPALDESVDETSTHMKPEPVLAEEPNGSGDLPPAHASVAAALGLPTRKRRSSNRDVRNLTDGEDHG